MTTMTAWEIFSRLTGMMFLLAVGVGLAALAVSAAARRIMELRTRRDDLVRSLYARDLGRELWSGAWWFPDPSVKRALHLIGISLQMHGGFRVDQIREKWAAGDEADVSDLVRSTR